MEKKIIEILDQGLALMSQEDMQGLVKEALETFKSPFSGQTIDLDIDNEFSDWMVNDYKIKGQSIFEYKNMTGPEQASIEASFVSIFKVSDEKDKIVFKDVFTQIDYLVQTTEVCRPGDLIKARLYPWQDHFLLISEPTFYDSNYESTVRKSVMYQYNSHCSVHGPSSVEDFIKGQSLMIYHLSSLIEYYEGVLEDDESLYVHLAKYKLDKKDDLLDVILDQNDFQLIEHNAYETLIHHMVADKIMAEILVDDQWMEVECTSKTDLMLTRERLEMLVGDKAVFLSESCLGLDDLLN